MKRNIRNTYNSLKARQQKDYYQMKCIAYKHNMKKLWNLINNTIKKVKHKGSIIPYITINGIQQHHPKVIANSFREFYSGLGKRLADNIIPGMTPTSTYLGNIPKNVNSIALRAITIPEIDSIIKQLPNKLSHSHDSISNIVLKALCSSIVYPLCHIFNASFMEGSFPSYIKARIWNL